MGDSDPYRDNRRKLIKGIGATSMIGMTSLAGCTQEEGNGNGEGGTNSSPNTGNNSDWPDLSGAELSFLTAEDSDSAREFFDRVNSDFNDATGATVEMNYREDKESVAIQRIQAGDPPELYTGPLGTVAGWAQQDILAPLTGALESITDTIGSPAEGTRFTHEDEDYYVPLWYNISTYWYRSDVTDIVPDTWDKVLEYAEALDGEDNIRGNFVPAGGWDGANLRLMSWLRPAGGSIATRNENGDIIVDFDEGEAREIMVRTLDFLKERYQYSPEALDAEYSEAQEAIPREVAYSGWYWGARPKTQSIDAGHDWASELRCVPGMPTPDDGESLASASLNGISIFDGGEVEAARTYLEFLFQEEYLNEIYFATSPIHNVPAFPEIQETEGWESNVNDLPDGWTERDIDDFLNAPFETIDQDTNPPNEVAAATYRTSPMWNMQIEVLANDMPPEDAIDEYAPQLQEEIDSAQN